MSDGGRLAVTVDGAALPEDEARALWTRFSQHMDAHRGDVAGFAKASGYASVTPTYERGRAVLVIRTTEAPAAAAPAPRPAKPNGPKPNAPKSNGPSNGAAQGGGPQRRRRRRGGR